MSAESTFMQLRSPILSVLSGGTFIDPEQLWKAQREQILAGRGSQCIRRLAIDCV